MSNDPKFIHTPQSPDVFADGATGFFTFNGCMRITLETVRSDYSGQSTTLDRVVLGRLVMPLGAAEAMANGILEQVRKLKDQEGAEQNATLQ